jgi:hypothetical protein
MVVKVIPGTTVPRTRRYGILHIQPYIDILRASSPPIIMSDPKLTLGQSSSPRGNCKYVSLFVGKSSPVASQSLSSLFNLAQTHWP